MKIHLLLSIFNNSLVKFWGVYVTLWGDWSERTEDSLTGCRAVLLRDLLRRRIRRCGWRWYRTQGRLTRDFRFIYDRFLNCTWEQYWFTIWTCLKLIHGFIDGKVRQTLNVLRDSLKIMGLGQIAVKHIRIDIFLMAGSILERSHLDVLHIAILSIEVAVQLFAVLKHLGDGLWSVYRLHDHLISCAWWIRRVEAIRKSSGFIPRVWWPRDMIPLDLVTTITSIDILVVQLVMMVI